MQKYNNNLDVDFIKINEFIAINPNLYVVELREACLL